MEIDIKHLCLPPKTLCVDVPDSVIRKSPDNPNVHQRVNRQTNDLGPRALREIGVTIRGYGNSFGGDKNVLRLMVVMVVQLCEHTKSHRIVHFKGMSFMTCELYLNQAVIKYICINIYGHYPVCTPWAVWQKKMDVALAISPI